MKTLKEQFQNYEVPVDEAGWESIIQDASVVKYNRGRKIRRGALYGAATLAVAGIVAVAVIFSHPQRVEPSQTSETTETSQEPVRQEVAPESAPAPAHAQPQAAANRITSATARVSANVPADNMTPASATPASIPAQTPPAAANAPAPQPAPATSASVPQPTPAPTPAVQPKQAPAPTPTHQDAGTPSAPKAESNENPTPQPQTTNKTFFAPNAFSPNGDGINDIFYVFANVEYTEFELNIYSRNGDHVFQSRNIENGWNGRRNGTGELLPQGVYVYTIKYKTTQLKSGMEKGQILLLQ